MMQVSRRTMRQPVSQEPNMISKSIVTTRPSSSRRRRRLSSLALAQANGREPPAAPVRKLTTAEKAAIARAEKDRRERVKLLQLEPVFEAGDAYMQSRSRLVFAGLGFLGVAFGLFLIVLAESPHDAAQQFATQLEMAVIVGKGGALLLTSATAGLATLEYVMSRAKVHVAFSERCYALGDTYTPEQLAAECRALKGPKYNFL